MSLLPVTPAHELPDSPEEGRWLLEGLWTEEGVGIIGGEPKCCKSFLALSLAVAVASGEPCLGRFRVVRKGRVLLFAAEDALPLVRRRLEGLCAACGRRLPDVDIQVITAPSVRLDLPEDRAKLAQTVAALAPRLLLLDPFVRLHRIDENASAEVAPLLAFLRELQRSHRMAVAVVHHAKKGGGGLRAGQALRGSSEFHAWGDSNLYLRRHGERLTLSVEHRAGPSSAELPLRLAVDGDVVALEVVPAPGPSPAAVSCSVAERIREVLRGAAAPIPRQELRGACRVRAATLAGELVRLVRDNEVVKTDAGYALAPR